MFLQDIAVKLNDFGVLVQLLVVDFFKFCFRNANDKQNNMNILGFQEVGIRVEELCCGNRRAFDIHQKRVRAALKEQIELGGESRA